MHGSTGETVTGKKERMMKKAGSVWKWISGTALAAVLLLVLAPQTARAEGSSVSTWGGLQE